MRFSKSLKLSVESLEHRAMLTTFFVDAAAMAGGDGSPSMPFDSIQLGINAAAGNDGADTVFIRGAFVENPLIDDVDPVTLRGKDGASVQSPDPLDDVISILSGDVTIRDLAVENGKNGIVATGDSLTLIDVDVRFSQGLDPDDDIVDGHGVVATNLDSVRVTRGNYSHNGAFEDMHGMLIERVANLRLDHVTAQENGQHGLDANRIGQLRVNGGTYTDNLDGDGIHVDRTESVQVVGGVYSDNDGDGIDLRRVDSATVVSVSVNRNGNEGIEVDDTGSLLVVGSQVLDNAEDGLDLDDVREITLIGVTSIGNGFDDPEDPGSGLQIEAEDDNDTESLLVIGSVFSGNAADGIQISEPDDDKRVMHVDLRAVVVSDNGQSGLDIDMFGDLVTKAVVSENNAEDDSIMTG